MRQAFESESGIPETLFNSLDRQETGLKTARQEHGDGTIPPAFFS
jgi:hypothetical protein